MSQATEKPITSPTRRAALAGGLALVAGTTVNAAAIVAAKSAEQDPIIGAIERHRALYIQQMASGAVGFDMVEGPEKDAADAIHVPDFGAAEEAAIDLTHIMPTTLAGVIKLLAYVDEFNAGKVVLPSDPGWHSYADGWPEDLGVSIGNEGECERPFVWLLMRNVANALRTIAAVQA